MTDKEKTSTHNTVHRQLTRSIKSKNSKIKANKIEASGILWNPVNQHYLLLSDEKYKGRAGLFVMDEEGYITAQIAMQNLVIDDLESISFDDDFFYILSSLSHNKKDKIKTERKKLVRFKYLDHKATKLEEIDLYSVLIKIIKAKTTDLEWVNFLKPAIERHVIDIESHFVKNNDLYLGFKSPLSSTGKTRIIKIKNVDALFEGSISQIESWQTIRLPDPETSEPMRLSDMLLVDDQLFLLAVSNFATKKSVLWQYQLKDKTLKIIQQYSGLQAEGISYHTEKALFIVIFDEGKKNKSRYHFFPFSIPG